MKRLSLIALLSFAIVGSMAPALADHDDWKKINRYRNRVYSRPYYVQPNAGYYYGNSNYNPNAGYYYGNSNYNSNAYWAPGQWRRHRGLGARISNPYYYNYYGR